MQPGQVTFIRVRASATDGKVGSTWGIGEAGAAGPATPYGAPAGHTWLAIDGPRSATRNIRTGADDRSDNLLAVATAALVLFAEVLAAS